MSPAKWRWAFELAVSDARYISPATHRDLLADRLSIVTSKDAKNELLELGRKVNAGEITKARLVEDARKILMRAKDSLTNDEFLEVQGTIRILHDILANGPAGRG